MLHACMRGQSSVAMPTPQEQLLIVRVTLANECVFISTLSPAAIPYAHTQRGVSRRRYLEVDPKFAAELGISQDTEVRV